MGNNHAKEKRSKSMRVSKSKKNEMIKITTENNSLDTTTNTNINTLIAKLYPIENDYVIFYNKKLGMGCNGDVLLCFNILNKKKYALKVSILKFIITTKISCIFDLLIVIILHRQRN